MKKIKVYIASPYTNGWTSDNVRVQLDALHILMDEGFDPFAPLINHYAEIHRSRPEHEWFSWDIAWLKMCDVLVRIHTTDRDGVEIPSSGADIEEQTAVDENMAVFNFQNLGELEQWASTINKQKLIK